MKNSLCIIMSLCCILLYSCGKEHTDPDSSGQAKPTVTGSVKTVTPKQVLLVCNVTIPDGIAQSEFGVAYSSTKGADSAAAEKVKARKSEGNTFEVLLAHLDCGTEYFYYPYVKAGDTYYFSSEQSFKTEALPDNAVDLHLSNDMLWAARNLGASSAEEAGDTYCWGETSPRVYDAHNIGYKLGLFIDEESLPVGYSKYTYDDGHKGEIWYDASGNFIGDGRIFLDAEDDAATAKLGGRWMTPSAKDIETLYTEVEHTWKKDSKGNFVVSFSKDGSTMDIRSYALYWTRDLTDSGVSLLESRYSSSAYSKDALKFQIEGKSDAGTNLFGKITPAFSFVNDSRFMTQFIRPVYDCSIEERVVSRPRDGYKTLTVEESPKIDPSELACISRADGSMNVKIIDRRVYRAYNPGQSMLSVASDGRDNNADVFGIQLFLEDIEKAAVGELLDIQGVGVCGLPYSSKMDATTHEISGKIRLVSKDDKRVILNWEDVRFTICNGEHVINGKMSCILK